MHLKLHTTFKQYSYSEKWENPKHGQQLHIAPHSTLYITRTKKGNYACIYPDALCGSIKYTFSILSSHSIQAMNKLNNLYLPLITTGIFANTSKIKLQKILNERNIEITLE